MRRSSLDLRITLGVVFLLALAAYQLQGTSVEAAENDTRGFVERESLPQQTDDEDYDPEANLPYLFAVFIVTWAGLFGYVFVMTRRRREMQSELDALRRVVAERDQPEEQQGDGRDE